MQASQIYISFDVITYRVTFIDENGDEQVMDVEAPSPLMVIPELPNHRRIISLQIIE